MPFAGLVKVPFVLVTAYSVAASYTNPNPSITNDERRPESSRNTTLFMHYIVKYMVLVRTAFWIIAAAEISAILLADLISAETAQRGLKVLMPSGNIADLRLTPLSFIGSLLTVFGCWIRLYSFQTLKRFFTFEITIRDNHKLITTGPYGWVRHPSYTGIASLFVGLVLWFVSPGSWVRESGILESGTGKAFIGMFAAVYAKLTMSLLQRMPEEDKLMKASFGKEWEEWARRVPYWLIPGVY